MAAFRVKYHFTVCFQCAVTSYIQLLRDIYLYDNNIVNEYTAVVFSIYFSFF